MNKLLKIIALAIICFLFISITGCHKRNKKAKEANSGYYPLTIQTYEGYSGGGQLVEQTFYKPPERIVATSIATIDNLIFLGLQDKIVAISDIYGVGYQPYENIYAQFPILSKGASYPSKEAVLSCQPDIIICWGSLFGDNYLGNVAPWHEKGIHTYLMTNTVPTGNIGKRKVEYFLLDLQNLAKIFNIEERSKKSISDLRERLRKISLTTENLAEKERPKVVTIQYVYDNEYLARSSNDLTSDIIWLAGGYSSDDQLGSRRSIEYLIKQDPDIILLVDTPENSADKKIEALKSNHVLRNVKAIKNNHFLAIEHAAFYCGSIRTLDAIEYLASEIDKIRENKKNTDWNGFNKI